MIKLLLNIVNSQKIFSCTNMYTNKTNCRLKISILMKELNDWYRMYISVYKYIKMVYMTLIV